MFAKFKSNILVIGIILAFIIGIIFPIGPKSASAIATAGDIGVGAVFLAYGMRIRTIEVLRGMRDLKLQGALLALTFILFPLIGLGSYYGIGFFSNSPFLLGLLYLTLLPSTIQSSVTFVSIAGGDVARAVCAATISNVIGIFITPLLVLLCMNVEGANAGSFTKVLYQLLLPFFIGQLFQPITGTFLRKHKWITKAVDTTSIVIIVLGAVVGATRAGVWTKVSGTELLLLLISIVAILFISLALAVGLSRVLHQPKSSEIVMIMCGSMKSLATGLPMANAIFPAATVAPLIVPVILYHQIQLFLCSILANRLGERRVQSNS